jgi:hypothetical protein
VRPEFYRLFDAARNNYIKETFPDILAEANVLSARYAEAQNEAMRQMSLRKIELEPNLNWFLSDPCDGISRGLFNPLFDLLKGKTTLAEFEDVAARLSADSFKRFSHFGYEYWAVFSLMCLIAPDAKYAVPVHDHRTDPDLATVEARPGQTAEVPGIALADTISFDTTIVTAYLAPKLILHSSQIETFVAFTVDLHDVFCNARVLSKKAEWLKIADLQNKFGKFNMWPDVCIYLHDEAETLRVSADYQNIARPDIVVDIMETADWYEAGKMEIVKQHHKELKPRLGSFVISRGVVPEPVIKALQAEYEAEQALLAQEMADRQGPTKAGLQTAQMLQETPSIHILNASYERAELEPIISAIVKSMAK